MVSESCNRSFGADPHRHTPGTHNHTQTPAEQGRRGQARQTHEVFRTRPTRRASKRASTRGGSTNDRPPTSPPASQPRTARHVTARISSPHFMVTSCDQYNVSQRGQSTQGSAVLPPEPLHLQVGYQLRCGRAPRASARAGRSTPRLPHAREVAIALFAIQLFVSLQRPPCRATVPAAVDNRNTFQAIQLQAYSGRANCMSCCASLVALPPRRQRRRCI